MKERNNKIYIRHDLRSTPIISYNKFILHLRKKKPMLVKKIWVVDTISQTMIKERVMLKQDDSAGKLIYDIVSYDYLIELEKIVAKKVLEAQARMEISYE